LIGATAAGLAFGQSAALGEENDALQIVHAKVSLTEAVAAAESKAGGRASKAEFEKTADGWVYDVEVVTGRTVSDVHVDAQTAAVLSVSEDAIDADDQQDPAD